MSSGDLMVGQSTGEAQHALPGVVLGRHRSDLRHLPAVADTLAGTAAQPPHGRLARLSPRWRVLTRRFGRVA
jgi:hypothetical protein